jgi:hypothetical protein
MASFQVKKPPILAGARRILPWPDLLGKPERSVSYLEQTQLPKMIVVTA